MSSSSRLPTLIAASVCAALYGPQVLAESDLPVLTETQTQAAAEADGVVLEREQIQSTPVANSDLSQLLKSQPAIGINDGTSALRGGDLAPEEISLADARPHQTNYMIGGVTTNNIATFGASDAGGRLGGHTSGYFVDTELLESVQVLDHNVDAEFGGFTGGVINAELRKPTDRFELEYSYRMTDSSWNSDPKLSDKHDGFGEASYGDGRYQPEYQKRFHTLFVGGQVSDSHKLGLGLSRKESDIPLSFDGKSSDQDQAIDNLFLTHLWQAGLWDIATELRYSSSTEERFLNDPMQQNGSQQGSQYENEHSGMGITVKLARDYDFGQWETTLAYDQLEDARRSDSDYFKTYFDYVEKHYFTQGGYGDQQQQQDSYKLKSLLRLNPLYWGQARHQLKAGVDLISQQAEGRFNGDFSSMKHTFRGEDDQQIDNWTRYRAGGYKADADQYALFVSDQMDWDRLTVNLGLRAERMELFDETVLAPRFSAGWDFGSDQTNRLTLGASRYYSGSLLGWALDAEKRALKSTSHGCHAINGDYSSTDISDYVCDKTAVGEASDLSQMDTPYANEFSAAWDLELGNLQMNASYVLRQQRKGLAEKVQQDSDTYVLLNSVESDSHIYTLKFSTIDRYDLLGGRLGAYLDLGYVDRTGAGNIGMVYDDTNDLNTGFEDEYLLVDGKLTKYSEMNTGSYNPDLTAALGINLEWAEYGVKWNNLVKFEGGRDLTLYQGLETVSIDGADTRVKSVKTTEMEDLITWDTKVEWTPSGWLDNHASLGLSVTNLLDKQVKVATHGNVINGNDNSVNYYNKGREIWLNLTLRN